MLREMRLVVAIVAALVVSISVIPRALFAAGALPDALRPFIWSDAYLIYARSLSGHRLPYVDGPFEYPPLIGAAAAIFSLIAGTPAAFVALWGALLAACAAGAALLLTRAATPSRVAARFALTPQLLLLGGINFDLLAVLFLVAALIAARAKHDGRTAVGLALGAASKLFPLAAAPIAVMRSSRPARSVAVLVVALAACYAPAIMAGSSAAGSPAFYLLGIPANLDSPGGLIASALASLGIAEAQLIVVVLSITGLTATYLFGVLPRAKAADPVSVFGLAIVATLAWSRLYSPQYSLWLLPLFVLLPLRGRTFALLTLGDLMVFLSIYPLTLVRWPAGDVRVTGLMLLLVAGVLTRHLALLCSWRELRQLAAAPPPRPAR